MSGTPQQGFGEAARDKSPSNATSGEARIEVLPGGGVRIGALARMSDVAADTEVRRRFPVVAEMTGCVPRPQAAWTVSPGSFFARADGSLFKNASRSATASTSQNSKPRFRFCVLQVRYWSLGIG